MSEVRVKSIDHLGSVDGMIEELGLEEILKEVFAKIYRQILSIAYYLTSRGGALSYCNLN